MSKRPIPAAPANTDAGLQRTIAALKENVEIMSGQRGGKIDPLSNSASTADIISKINELISVLQ